MSCWVLEYRPFLAVMVSMVAALLILFSGKRPNLRETWTLLAALAKAALVLSMVPMVLHGDVLENRLLQLTPEFSLALRVDPLGLFFALVSSILWIFTSVYNIGYMRAGGYKNQTGYFASFAVCLSATIGLAFSANLLTFFVFYEILTIATYPLVIHDRTAEAISAGRKYLVYTLVSGQALLIAVLWTGIAVPGAEFTPGGFLEGSMSSASLAIVFGLFVIGCGVKAGLMPMHAWLPAAMVAPTPVSALLHAVAVVKAGVFGILRVVGFVFGGKLLANEGLNTWLMAFAAMTILLGSMRALGEINLKRRLAFSTISQLSYIILGASLNSVAAFAGAVFHIAAHAFMKITLFFCAGAIYIKNHKSQIPDTEGMGKTMIATFSAFTLGAMGMAGIPLLPGFLSKWNIGVGSLAVDEGIIIPLLVLSGLLNIAYFFPIVYGAFFKGGQKKFSWNEAPAMLWIPLSLTGIGALILGIFPNAFISFYRLAWMVAQQVFSGGM